MLLERLDALHGTIHRTDATFRFNVITGDPDDNEFVDCAIAARAESVVTEDQHFSALATSGYAPRAVSLEGLRNELTRRRPKSG